MPYYAVRRGRVTGVYTTWEQCQSQVKGFPDCSFKKFPTESQAWEFVRQNVDLSSSNSKFVLNSNHVNGSLTTSAITNIIKNASEVFQPSSSNISSCSQVFNGRKSSFYAVHRGKRPGVYSTWTECEIQIKDFKNPSYRKLPTLEEAKTFVKTGGIKKINRNEAKRMRGNNEFENTEKDEWALDDLKVEVDPDKTVTVFTDGASAHNGKANAAAGIGVYWGPNHPLNTSMRLPGRQTNNRAEIFAAVHALRQARQIGVKNVKLYTDSQFLIHGITDWINKWKRNNWTLANGQPVKNKEDFMELDKARTGLNVDWIYIRAHANNPGNDEADRLAVEGAKKTLDDTIVLLI